MPVMVRIHGGRYLERNASNPYQDGTVLANAGVVMVRIKGGVLAIVATVVLPR
jgi:carboxylesterase type B